MPAAHLLLLSGLLSAALAAAPVPQLSATVAIPGPRYCGEPLYACLTLTNAGAEPTRVPALWRWNGGPVMYADRWWRVERKVDERWVPVSSAGFLGPRVLHEGPAQWLVWLDPGEHFEVWYDLAWDYDLGPGEYRVVLSGLPVFGGLQRALTAPAVTEFTVLPLAGRDLACWQAGEANRARVHNGRSVAGTCRDWLRPDLDGVAAGTCFEPWGCWHRFATLELEYTGHLGGPDSETHLIRLADYCRTHPDWPLAPRMAVIGPFYARLRGRSGADADWPETERALLRLLQTTDDLELVAWLVPFVAEYRSHRLPWRNVDGREEVLFEALREWKYPWFTVPSAERPRF